MTIYQTSVPLTAVGGTAPYAFTVLSGASTTIPATIAGSTLTVDATGLEPGTYTVLVQVTDQAFDINTLLVEVDVLYPNSLQILNRDVSYQPEAFPYAGTVPLLSVGGTGASVWSIIPSVTTLPGAAISGSTLSFTISSYGEWTVGIKVTDSLANSYTKVLTYAVQAPSVVSIVDGQVRLNITPGQGSSGHHQFTLEIVDTTQTAIETTFFYTIKDTVSTIDVTDTAVDHFWGTGDTATVVLPIAGDLSGFILGPTSALTATNGLIATINPDTATVSFSGPPTSFGNSLLGVSIPLLQGSTQVATITRDFTLISHGGDTSTLGALTCSTRPFIVGDLIGLNPLRAGFNSPLAYRNSGYVVALQTGSTLPLGLSLDATSGLIYGTVLASDVTTSVLTYTDSLGNQDGLITVNWDILTGQFNLIDGMGDAQLQAEYTGSVTTTSSTTLTSATAYRGSLPDGIALAVSTDGSSVVVSGIATEAGWFDCWIRVTNSNNQSGYLYKRFVSDYLAPLIIVSSLFAPVYPGTAYSDTLAGFGGEAPYTWAISSGTLPTGLSLGLSSGVVSGTTYISSYSQPLIITVTDSRGSTASATLTLQVVSGLTITTQALPIITPGALYSYQLTAQGGQGTYSWALGNGSSTLPAGISLSTSGLLSGATSLQVLNETIIVQATDTANNVSTAALALSVGAASTLVIDTEGLGDIVRGAQYLGTLRVEGPGVAPYYWSVTPDTPNPLPTGLSLITYANTSGTSVAIQGTTDASLDNYSVKIQVVDSKGNSAYAYLLFNTYSTIAVSTTVLPQATVAGTYSSQLAANGVNTPFVWTLDPSSPGLPPGMSLSSTGVLSGTPTTAGGTNLVFRVTDSINDSASGTLSFVAKASTLLITTTSLSLCSAGVAYNASLAATGGQAPYTWSISPGSTDTLPSGLTFSAATGTISGKTLSGGITRQITFRVTDAISVYREVTLALTVQLTLSMQAGPNNILGAVLLTNNFLGYVTKGNVLSMTQRPNRSFQVLVSNLNSTDASQLAYSTTSGFQATTISFTSATLTAQGSALVQISGPFASYPIGSNALTLVVNDSGVSLSQQFAFIVTAQYTTQFARADTLSTTFPILYS